MIVPAIKAAFNDDDLLEYAVMDKHILLKAALDKGLSPNYQMGDNTSLLNVVNNSSSVKCFKLLVDAGADIHAHDRNKHYPLGMALLGDLHTGTTQMLELMYDAGVDLNRVLELKAAVYGGEPSVTASPIYLSLTRALGSVSACKFILDKGVDTSDVMRTARFFSNTEGLPSPDPDILTYFLAFHENKVLLEDAEAMLGKPERRVARGRF